MTRYQGISGAMAPPRPMPAGGGAKIAVSLVLNYEEGARTTCSTVTRSQRPSCRHRGGGPWPGMRHWNMESIYDYGARAGFWRLHRLFTGLRVPVTIYGVTSALARNPEQVAAMREAGGRSRAMA